MVASSVGQQPCERGLDSHCPDPSPVLRHPGFYQAALTGSWGPGSFLLDRGGGPAAHWPPVPPPCPPCLPWGAEGVLGPPSPTPATPPPGPRPNG